MEGHARPTNVWLQSRRGSSGRPMLCFPPSGGTATSFAAWVTPARPDLDLIGVQLPGRGVRIREPELETMEELVASMGPAIGPVLPDDYYILGYCLGGILAYEFTRWLMTTAFPKPAKLFICCCGAPDTDLLQGLEDLSDAELIEQLRRWGGMSEAMLANRKIMELALPPLRTDLRLLSRYQFTAGPTIDVPISAFYGVDDHTLSIDAVKRWEHCTSAAFECRELVGAHFPAPESVLAAVREQIA